VGGTASFGADIGGLWAVPSAGPGAEPLSGGLGAKPPEAKSLFCFTIFSEARAEIKRFDRFWRMMAQNVRNRARMCVLGLKYLMWCWLLAGKRLLKLLKLNNSFIV